MNMWLNPNEEMPEIEEHDDGNYSEAVLIKDNNRCIWLARWDGEVWRNVNTSDQIWLNKDSIEKWFRIPK